MINAVKVLKFLLDILALLYYKISQLNMQKYQMFKFLLFVLKRVILKFFFIKSWPQTLQVYSITPKQPKCG